MRPTRLLLLPLTVTVLHAQVPDLWMRRSFTQSDVNTVLILETPKNAETLRKAFHKLLQEDELVSLDLLVRVVADDPADRERTAAWVRSNFGLANAQWAVLGKNGKILISGKQTPTASALAAQLVAAGITSPIATLQTFLKSHPDHIEAKAELIRLLRKTAEERTRRILSLDLQRPDEVFLEASAKASSQPRPATTVETAQGFEMSVDVPDEKEFWEQIPKNKELAPEDDLKIWAPLAQQMDGFLASGDWLEVWEMSRDPLPVEACSPLMKMMYRRRYSSVQDALRASPLDPSAWSMWAWMTAILGEEAKAASFVRTLQPFLTDESKRSWPPDSEFLLAAARKSADWSLIRDILQQRLGWLMEAQKMLAEEASRHEMRGRKGSQNNEALDDTVWSKTFAPYLEALIRGKFENEACGLLAECKSYPQLAPLVTRAAALARSLNRPDLAQQWRSLQATPTQPTPPSREDQPLLLFQGVELRGLDRNRLAAEPMDLSSTENEERPWRTESKKRWREYLSWPVDHKGWALVTPAGDILARGGQQLPETEDLVRTLATAGFMTPLERARVFLREQPGHMDANLALLAGLFREAWNQTAKEPGLRERMRAASSQNPQGAKSREIVLLDETADEKIWGDFARRFSELLESSDNHFLSRFARVTMAASGEMPPLWRHSPLFKDLAKRTQPRVEELLTQLPTRSDLWALWIVFHQATGEGSAKELVDRLVPSPSDSPEQWPPMDVMRAYLKDLREQGLWKDVENFFRKNWERNLEMAEAMLTEAIQRKPSAQPSPENAYSNWMWTASGMPLVEALLQQGRDGEAGEIVDAWTSRGGKLPGLERLCTLAETLKMNSLAEKWRKLIDTKPPSRTREGRNAR